MTAMNEKIDEMPKHEKCFYYEYGCFTDPAERGKHYCVPDEAKTLGERWEMKQEINPEQCENCQRYECRYIEYPLTINGLDIKEPKPWGIRPGLCRVRPAAEKKTYLGIYIGEIPRYTSASLDKETGILEISSACNPMIYIPELNRAVFGDESWWSRIEDGEDISDITDDDIKGQWYMRILQEAAGVEEKPEEAEPPSGKEECIRDLKGSMELYLFDPSTGETLTPEQLNDMDRMTYEAMKKAVELLEAEND